MDVLTDFAPGSLITARDREWVVQPGSEPDLLHLRPLGGSGEDTTTLIPGLEEFPPEPSRFSFPDPGQRGAHDSARLLRDALLFKTRAGAGPFRSFGNIAFEPRAYQLVPLLMALRMSTVRLLIADDVGIGKTIEAGLIVRELLDRGEISRFAVLCPPHLTDQWRQELEERFHIKAVVLTAASVRRIEQSLPAGKTLFDQHPFVIVSLDYIKSERHRAHFLSIAPECIITDEAHTCTVLGRGRQLRFELLKQLAEDSDRHLILLTATPHSGDDQAFHNLLSLLKPEFATLHDVSEARRRDMREDLAAYFVQRRRKDIEEWQDTRLFPTRYTTELTYKLNGNWAAFFDEVQDYCLRLAERIESARGQQGRMIWYATLALLRCVASSPAAAERALTTRLQNTAEQSDEIQEATDLMDDGMDDSELLDLEPAAAIEDQATLSSLIELSRDLQGQQGDPKLDALVKHLRELVRDNFRPVVFCRYIATAEYVAEHLRGSIRGTTVDAVSGNYTPEEREARVTALIEAEKPILVATDCLSEGINLQHGFNAVVHYDLAWNPTRHEQREGRVDRFGQPCPEVRCTMLYGHDNPVDGFILNVILRKAREIQRELGVLVPMPADKSRIDQALIKAALLKRNNVPKAAAQQLEMFEDLTGPDLDPIQTAWEDAREKARANRTIFAQRRLRPADVLPEWQKQIRVLGTEEDIHRFVSKALHRLNAPLEELPGGLHRFVPAHLPPALRERLEELGLHQEGPVSFRYPAPASARFIHRTHPLVTILSDHLLESSLAGEKGLAARAAVTVTRDVEIMTTVYLLRLRHQLTYSKRQEETRQLLAEETLTLAVKGTREPEWTQGEEARALLDVTPSGNVPDALAERQITNALSRYRALQTVVDELARARAEELLQDHRRVREAADARGSYQVTPCLPVDIMGVYVLLPEDV